MRTLCMFCVGSSICKLHNAMVQNMFRLHFVAAVSEWMHVQGSISSFFILPTFSVGVNFYRKEFAPGGANSSFKSRSPFGSALLSRNAKSKIIPLCKNGGENMEMYQYTFSQLWPDSVCLGISEINLRPNE